MPKFTVDAKNKCMMLTTPFKSQTLKRKTLEFKKVLLLAYQHSKFSNCRIAKNTIFVGLMED